MHWFATDMGRAGPSPPLASQFTRDIAGDDVATEGLLRVLNHDIPPSRLFTPRRLGRAAVRAVRANPGQTRAIAREAAMELQNEIRRSRERHRRRRALRLPA
jgi:menaquinone-9 beta-reductase